MPETNYEWKVVARLAALLLLALIVLVLFGVGFTLHLLWWIAIIAALIWVIGFFLRPSGRRWYYW